MIGFDELDLMARGGTLALLLLLSILLWRDHRAALAARLALGMNAAIASHVIASIPGPLGPWRLIDIVLDTGSSAVFGFFWLFTRAWFEDLPKISWRSWIIAMFPTAIVAMLDSGRMDQQPMVASLCFPMLRAWWFALSISALWIAWRGRDDDLVEARRRVRMFMVVAVGALAIVVNSVEIAVFVLKAPPGWRSVTEFGVVIATLLVCAAIFGMRQADLFGARTRPGTPTPPAPVDDPLATRLLAHMDREKPHRNEMMTIAALAQQLGEQEYRLRRLINGTLGHRNFAQFLNGYRLSEVKAALADPEQKEVPILTIALDAGFGSLGPFNRAFREAEGMTPSAWRVRAGQRAETASMPPETA